MEDNPRELIADMSQRVRQMRKDVRAVYFSTALAIGLMVGGFAYKMSENTINRCDQYAEFRGHYEAPLSIALTFGGLAAVATAGIPLVSAGRNRSNKQ